MCAGECVTGCEGRCQVDRLWAQYTCCAGPTPLHHVWVRDLVLSPTPCLSLPPSLSPSFALFLSLSLSISLPPRFALAHTCTPTAHQTTAHHSCSSRNPTKARPLTSGHSASCCTACWPACSLSHIRKRSSTVASHRSLPRPVRSYMPPWGNLRGT